MYLEEFEEKIPDSPQLEPRPVNSSWSAPFALLVLLALIDLGIKGYRQGVIDRHNIVSYQID